MSNKFPTKIRLSGKEQFKNVFAKGKKISTAWFSIFYCKNELGYARIGIVATKKNLANAVARNRFKRIARESFRLMSKIQSKDLDIVVFAYKKAVNLNDSDLRKWLDQYLEKLI